VSTIIYIIEGLTDGLPVEKKTPDVMESIFIFAAVWAFGGPMIIDKQVLTHMLRCSCASSDGL
jgi:hypothetical protein